MHAFKRQADLCKFKASLFYKSSGQLGIQRPCHYNKSKTADKNAEARDLALIR